MRTRNVGIRHIMSAKLPSRRGLLRAALLALSVVAPGFAQTYDLLLQGGHVVAANVDGLLGLGGRYVGADLGNPPFSAGAFFLPK